MTYEQLKTELKEKEGLLKIYEQKPKRERLQIEIYNTYRIRCEISTLKKGIEACEEALSKRNKEILEIIEKWYFRAEGVYEEDYEELIKQLTEEKK